MYNLYRHVEHPLRPHTPHQRSHLHSCPRGCILTTLSGTASGLDIEGHFSSVPNLPKRRFRRMFCHALHRSRLRTSPIPHAKDDNAEGHQKLRQPTLTGLQQRSRPTCEVDHFDGGCYPHTSGSPAFRHRQARCMRRFPRRYPPPSTSHQHGHRNIFLDLPC